MSASDAESEDGGVSDPDYVAPESSEEEDEFTAGIADADLELDLDRQAKRVRTSFMRMELRALRKQVHETEMRQREGMES